MIQLRLYYLDGGPGLANTWRTYQVSLVESSFQVGSRVGPVATDNDLTAVLSNLTAIYILGDWINGSETGRLDNFALRSGAVPEPKALLLVIFGIVPIIHVRWRNLAAPGDSQNELSIQV